MQFADCHFTVHYLVSSCRFTCAGWKSKKYKVILEISPEYPAGSVSLDLPSEF